MAINILLAIDVLEYGGLSCLTDVFIELRIV